MSTRRGKVLKMTEWLWPVLFVAAYFIVMRWILPYFGVPT
jgi:hypothetical protein